MSDFRFFFLTSGCAAFHVFTDKAVRMALEAGAYDDLIILYGNPLEDLSLAADPEKNFVLIMKDGKIYKNTITN